MGHVEPRLHDYMTYFKFLIILLAAVTIGLISCGSNNGVNKPSEPIPKSEESSELKKLNYIFKSGIEGYHCFRIPAMVKTKDNTLLAFAEARKGNCNDEENIDLVVKRSTDGGETWSNMITVWDEGENTAGNPAPVVDRETGKIHLLMTWNLGEDDIGEINRGTSEDTRRVFYTWSDDDGQSWKEPEEITSSVKEPHWGWYATGPVHGIQIRQGEDKGRLVIPCDYIEVGPDRQGYSHVIYSDDNGETWELGGVAPQAGGNESTVAELSDGRLMLNMRSNDPVRQVSISDDGGETWGEVELDDELKEPTCQGSLLSCEVDGSHALLFSNPASSAERIKMTVKRSTDNGATWSESYLVYKGPSAYSDIVMVNKDEIGILYEAGTENPYGGIVFERIPLPVYAVE